MEKSLFTTPLCCALGIKHPIFSAGIGAAAGPALAAAVSNAGGCVVLGTASLPGKFVRAQIQRLKELTAKPFGVDIVLALLRRGALYAGQSCSLIDAVQPAAEIVSDIVRSAAAAFERLSACHGEDPPPVM